jgi:hypothetical protein
MKMSLLSTAIKATQKQGMRACLYGLEGVGKSSLAGSLNNTLYIAAEKGYTNLDLERNTVVEINEFTDLLNLFSEVNSLISSGENKFENIVIDSVSAVERMLHRYIISTDPKSVNNPNITMLSALTGYGSAFNVANRYFTDVLAWGDFFVSQGINFIFTAHCFTDVQKDSEYQMEFNFIDVNLYSPKSSKNIGTRELLTQFVDLLGYLHFSKPDNNNDKPKRVLGVQLNDRYRAKNRFDVDDVITIPRDNAWNAVADVILECSGKDYRTT